MLCAGDQEKWPVRVQAVESGQPAQLLCVVAAATESTASAPAATGPRSSQTPPPSPVSYVAQRRVNCYGCLYECGNQEAHYGGCIDDPYEDDTDAVAREVASFTLTFGGGDDIILIEDYDANCEPVIDVSSSAFVFPWAADTDERAGSPQW